MSKADEELVRGMLEHRLAVKIDPGKYRTEWGEADGYAVVAPNLLLLIEVERSQNHTTTNILKTWPLLETRSELKIILAHVFFLNSRSVTGTRRNLSDWLVETMQDRLNGRFTYCRLMVDERGSRVGGIGNLRKTISRLKAGDPL